jgi:hypothetical protein
LFVVDDNYYKMSERNSSRLPFNENISKAQIPIRNTWR